MGMRVRRFDYLWNNWGLRFIWDEGTSIGKEEDRPFLSDFYAVPTQVKHGIDTNGDYGKSSPLHPGSN